MNLFKNVSYLVLVSVSFACSSTGSAVDIGTSRSGQKLEDYAASWVGYAETYQFMDGSDEVRISLDPQGNGTLEIGDTAALPPATDPDVVYPPNALGTLSLAIPALFAGISYQVQTATVASARIQLQVNPWQVESDWCALQTPYAVQGTDAPYKCLPSGVIPPANAPPYNSCWVNNGTADVQVDCKKAITCSGSVCSCTSSGCSAHEAPVGSVNTEYTQLDATLADGGDSLVGTMLIATNPSNRINVRLTRH